MSAQPIAIHGKLIDEVCDGDFDWFELHRNRKFRIRNYVPYELNIPIRKPPEGHSWRTVVVQIQRGVRARLPVSLDVEHANEDFSEDEIQAIFNLATGNRNA